MCLDKRLREHQGCHQCINNKIFQKNLKETMKNTCIKWVILRVDLYNATELILSHCYLKDVLDYLYVIQCNSRGNSENFRDIDMINRMTIAGRAVRMVTDSDTISRFTVSLPSYRWCCQTLLVPLSVQPASIRAVIFLQLLQCICVQQWV